MSKAAETNAALPRLAPIGVEDSYRKSLSGRIAAAAARLMTPSGTPKSLPALCILVNLYCMAALSGR